MVASVHPSHSQPLVDSAMESFSYRWLVTMASLGMEPLPSSNVVDDVGVDGQHPGYFIDVDPKAAAGGGGRDTVDDELEFEFLLPIPSRVSPPPADRIISGGLLLPFQQTDDYRCKDHKPAKKGENASLDDIRALSRSLSADSWSSSGTMFSSCPSRLSSASLSSCSSDAPLKPKKTRRLSSPAPPPRHVTAGLSPLLPRLPKPQEVNKAPKKGGISLASIPQRIARLCLCLLAAACRRAAAAVSAANNGNSNKSPSSCRETKTSSSAVGSRSRNVSNKKNGRRGVSSAIQWCRTESDAAVENSIHEAVLHCKRSYSRTD